MTTWGQFRLARLWLGLLILAFAGERALAYSEADRLKPRSVQPIQVEPQSSFLFEKIEVQEVVPPFPPDFDQKILSYFNPLECEALLKEKQSRDFEKLPAEELAVVAACEPPGKDPEKMFDFAEKQFAASDKILLLRARYRLKHHYIDASVLFEKLFKQTKKDDLRLLASRFLPKPVEPVSREPLHYAVRAQTGGLEEANPKGVALSDPSFGNDVSTAGLAQFVGSFRKPFGRATFRADYMIDDTTYWKTHAFDMLNQDADLDVEWKTSGTTQMGLRPFASFYTLAGTRYYLAEGLGFVGRWTSELIDQDVQLSYYQELIWLATGETPNGGHERIDWHGTLKTFPLLSPVLGIYVDQGGAGTSNTASTSVPYSHSDFGLSVSLSRLVHRYAVGLNLMGVLRQDTQQTTVIDGQGNSNAKTRTDFQLVIRPNLTIQLTKGLDLYMYFESSSTASNMTPSYGLDRNISDNTIGALLRVWINNL